MTSLKRLCKRLAIALAILAGVLLLANAGYGWWIGRQLELRLAVLRIAGEPTSFAELGPKPIAPELNAAVQLASLSSRLKDFGKEHGAFFKTPVGESFVAQQEQGLDPTPEQVTAIGEILVKYEDLPQKLRQAANCPAYASQFDYTVDLAHLFDEMLQQWFVRLMKTERAINISLSRDLFAHGWWVSWLGNGLQLDIIDYYDRLLPMLVQTWHTSTPPFAQLNKFSHRNYVSGVMIDLMIPAFQAGFDAVYRDLALIRSLRIINAITAHTQQQGEPPTGLEGLKLPAPATIDPFSGKPLQLKQTDKGWVVYSVFKNRTDDGGNFKDQADLGLAPVGYKVAE